VLDIVPDGDEGRTSRVRLRVEQLDSKHTKGILLLHAFGSVIALAVAIATVVLLHQRVSFMWTACESGSPRSFMHARSAFPGWTTRQEQTIGLAPSKLRPRWRCHFHFQDRVPTRVAAALQTQASWLADRHLDDVNLVFGKHCLSFLPPCQYMYLVARARC